MNQVFCFLTLIEFWAGWKREPNRSLPTSFRTIVYYLTIIELTDGREFSAEAFTQLCDFFSVFFPKLQFFVCYFLLKAYSHILAWYSIIWHN